MAYTSVEKFSSGDPVKKDRPNTIQDNIQDLRDRLVDASSYNWSEMPVSSGGPVENEDINELKEALDGAEDAKTCEYCSDNLDCSNVGDNGDVGDNSYDDVTS